MTSGVPGRRKPDADADSDCELVGKFTVWFNDFTRFDQQLHLLIDLNVFTDADEQLLLLLKVECELCAWWSLLLLMLKVECELGCPANQCQNLKLRFFGILPPHFVTAIQPSNCAEF